MMNIHLSKMQNHNVTLVGQSKVGKTALFVWFKESKFVETKPQKFEESYNKSWYIGHKQVSMTLFDTGNIETHNPGVINTYFRKSKVVIFVYDITDMDSFDYLSHWGNQSSESKDIITVLVGNKVDLEEEREVSETRIIQFTHNFDIPENLIFEVSAKTGQGVERMYEEIAKVMYSLEVEPQRVPVSSSERRPCWCC